jgi:hypothetical protein
MPDNIPLISIWWSHPNVQLDHVTPTNTLNDPTHWQPLKWKTKDHGGILQADCHHPAR